MGKPAQENMEISVTVRGELSAKAGIKILKGGEVIGLISGKAVQVEGTIRGKVVAEEEIRIVPQGQVEGEMEAKALCVEKGAFYRGKCRIGLNPSPEESLRSVEPQMTKPEKTTPKRWFWQS